MLRLATIMLRLLTFPLGGLWVQGRQMFRFLCRINVQKVLGRPVLSRVAQQARFLSDQHGVDIDYPSVPEYKPRTQNESVDRKRARLLYQSRKRGMLENGLLLSTFAAEQLAGLTESQLGMYDNLINKPTNDWEIYYWITGKQDTPSEYNNEIMVMLKKHAKNENNDKRYQQPPLY